MPSDAERSLKSLFKALGCPLEGELRASPKRAAELWRSVLLQGEGKDPVRVLGKGISSRTTSPVLLQGIGVHMVCPHHLTVAFGTAQIAYVPRGRIVSFGKLADLLTCCTARLVLQEEATDEIVRALMEGITPQAAWCEIKAEHPCHRLTRPRDHASEIITWAEDGSAGARRILAQRVRRKQKTGAPKPVRKKRANKGR